jgi:ATP-dependent HslUV protease ATP-binding subunit HslU
LQRLRAADAAGALSGGANDPFLTQQQEHGDDQQQQQPQGRPEAPYDLKPFPRRRERDPYRLLGVDRDASFDEVQDARNYLCERYKWDEPSREAIEAAFDKLLQTHYRQRKRTGFQPPGFARRGGPRALGAPSAFDRVAALFDPTVTTRTIINEGAVFGAFALWVLFSSDQSFPLAGAFAYCVYQFQQKRVKRDPEGPFFLGNPLVGAVLSTLAVLAVACGVMAVLTGPLTAVIGQSARQVGAFVTIAVMGVLGMYLK